MGKIFDALEKFSKERGTAVPDRIKDSDYEVLLLFDEATGKIDFESSGIAKDREVMKRLKTYRLINDNGTLTPAGKAKYEQMTSKSKKDMSIDSASTIEKPIAKQKESDHLKFGKTTDSVWTLLMQYDRKTGNLLKYEPETGQIDEDSINILKDSETIQRLIDNQMILPGGWLTPEAKRKCARMEEEIERKQTEVSVKPENRIDEDKHAKSFELQELLGQSDTEVLMQYDPETLKLDLGNPEIINDQGIVKRLMENDMIDAEGKLSPKALVRCRVLQNWASELEKMKGAQEGKKQSAANKVEISAKTTQISEAFDQVDNRKLKIINLKEEKEKAQVKDGVSTADYETTYAKRNKALTESRFALGKTPTIYDKSLIDKNMVTLLNPNSFEAEQFKILRTNLLFPTSGNVPRSIIVTSVYPGEGKSFVAANLAVSVATHVNWNVLLIDCDLRKPSIHRQFGFENVAGLSDYLLNDVQLQSLLQKTAVERLTILPGGRSPSNPSELLSSERMAAFIDEVVARYDDRIIILDSPPPKLTAESTALARHVDGILLVVKYPSTSRSLIAELINKLGKNKILGAIINNFDAATSRYHKKYYGDYYSGNRS